MHVLFLGLVLLGFLLTGCGEGEFSLEKIFIMDDSKAEDSKSDLTPADVEGLETNIDDETVVRKKLESLARKQFNLEDQDDRQTAVAAIHYAIVILKRSDFIPEAKQSPCDCHYASETFKLAVQLLANFSTQMHTQKIITLRKDEKKGKDYEKIYDSFKEAKTYLKDISDMDVADHVQAEGDATKLEEIQTIAKKALETLSKTSDSSSEKSKKDNTKKD